MPTLEEQFKTKYKGVSDEVATAKVAEGWTPTPTPTPVTNDTTSDTSNKNSYNFSRPNTPLETAQAKYYEQFAQAGLPDEDAIRERELKAKEGLISGIEQTYANKIAEAQQTTEGQLGQQRALASVTGQLGTPRGSAQKTDVTKAGAKVVEGIEAEKQYKLAQIFGNIDTRVEEKLQFETEQSRLGQEAYIDYLGEEAKADKDLATSFITSGGDPDVLSDEDYGKLRGLVPEMNDFLFDAFVNENKPKEEQDEEITTKWQDGNFVRIVQKADGTIETKTYTSEELGISQDEAIDPKFVDIAGVKYFYDGSNLQLDADGKPILKALGSTSKGTIVKPETQTTLQTFDEFVQEKVKGMGASEAGVALSDTEQYKNEYNNYVINNTYITDKNEAKQYVNTIIQASPTATYEELYALADTATSLTASDIKSYLSIKGFEPIKKSAPQESEMTDEELKAFLGI